MDYPPVGGQATTKQPNNLLRKYQWHTIHNPRISLFGGEEEEVSSSNHAGINRILLSIRASILNRKKVILELRKNTYYTAEQFTFYPVTVTISSISIKILKTVSFINVRTEQIEKDFHYPNYTSNQKYYDIYVSDIFRITFISEKERDFVFDWLLRKGNVMLFVNGYRNKYSLKEEYDDTDDKIATFDRYDYWKNENIDRLFANRRNVANCYYADGHMSITSSNHLNKDNFINSLISSTNAHYYNPPPKNEYDIDIQYDANCYHNNDCVHLNTTPNAEGFNRRKNKGRKAGETFVKILKNSNFNLETDRLDIVCHSMGFAYAQGMIEVITEQLPDIKLGGYYIIAPENACSGTVDITKWKEIWQYGSDELNTYKWLQDGVAPQCPIKGIKDKRAFIPKNWEPQGFLESHSVENYTWIFDRKTGKKGYVTPRN